MGCKWEMKNWQRADAQKWRGMEASKTEIAMGIALKVTCSEWEKNGKMIDRRNWRLLTENVARER